MKKTIFISALTILAFIACKKDRTCTCTTTPVSTTVNGQTTPVGQPSTDVTKITKVNKDEADCNSGEETVSQSTVYSGTVFAVVSVTKKDCKLD